MMPVYVYALNSKCQYMFTCPTLTLTCPNLLCLTELKTSLVHLSPIEFHNLLVFNPWAAKLFFTKDKYLLHFTSFLYTEVPKMVGILPMEDKILPILHYQYHSYWCPGDLHQQQWYLPNFPEYSSISTWKVKLLSSIKTNGIIFLTYSLNIPMFSFLGLPLNLSFLIFNLIVCNITTILVRRDLDEFYVSTTRGANHVNPQHWHLVVTISPQMTSGEVWPIKRSYQWKIHSNWVIPKHSSFQYHSVMNITAMPRFACVYHIHIFMLYGYVYLCYKHIINWLITICDVFLIVTELSVCFKIMKRSNGLPCLKSENRWLCERLWYLVDY